MVGKTCTECGRPIEGHATGGLCPSCAGAPAPSKHPSGGSAVGQWVAAGFVLVVGAMVFSRCEPATSTRLVDLDVAARKTATQIHVSNESSTGWTGCEIEINGRWSTDGVAIGSGETAVGGLMSFTDDDGARFNPGTHAVERLSVACDTPRGRGYWSGAL